MNPFDRRQHSEFRRELEPNILPRQVLALERVATRLEAARPRPSREFRAELDERVDHLGGSVRVSSGAPWMAPALTAVALGVVLLLVAAALAL